MGNLRRDMETKKNQIDVLEMNNTKLEMKTSLHGLNKVLDTAQEIISEPEYRLVESIQIETKRKVYKLKYIKRQNREKGI